MNMMRVSHSGRLVTMKCGQRNHPQHTAKYKRTSLKKYFGVEAFDPLARLVTTFRRSKHEVVVADGNIEAVRSIFCKRLMRNWITTVYCRKEEAPGARCTGHSLQAEYVTSTYHRRRRSRRSSCCCRRRNRRRLPARRGRGERAMGAAKQCRRFVHD